MYPPIYASCGELSAPFCGGGAQRGFLAAEVHEGSGGSGGGGGGDFVMLGGVFEERSKVGLRSSCHPEQGQMGQMWMILS